MVIDTDKILHSQMSITTTLGSVGFKASHQPNTSGSKLIEIENLDLFQLIQKATTQSYWEVHDLLDLEHGTLKDLSTGNTLLHSLIESVPQLVIHQSKEGGDYVVNNWNYPEYAQAACALIYRLIVKARCHVNAQNNLGNTALHLACLKPHADILVQHLIRLGADPEIRNRAGLHVFYNEHEHRAWLIKDFPGLKCGIWNAIKREDINQINQLLSYWCRTVATQPCGKSLFEAAMSTGNYDLVRYLDKIRTTNELVVASLALDEDYVREILHVSQEKEMPQLNTCDQSFDPPRPLLAELRIVLGSKADSVIQLLKSHGAPDETEYMNLLNKQKQSFNLCPFVRQIAHAKSVNDLNRAFDFINAPSFQPNLRHYGDQYTYLHFVVERYLSLSHKPEFQRHLIRIMFKLALVGVDVQARDRFGRTALVLAASPPSEYHWHDFNNIPLLDDPTYTEHASNDGLNHQDFPIRFKQEDDENQDRWSSRASCTLPSSMKTQSQTDDKSVVAKSSDPRPLGEKHLVEETDDESGLGRSSFNSSHIEVRGNIKTKFHIPDQHLLASLLQIGADSSMSSNQGKAVHLEVYVPKHTLVLKPRRPIPTIKLLGKSNKSSSIQQPGIWPLLDHMLPMIQHHPESEEIPILIKELCHRIDGNLIRIRAKRCGLTALDLVRGMQPYLSLSGRISSVTSNDSTDRSTGEICKTLNKILHSYVELTEFACSAMAGDLERMKYWLAMGNGEKKAQLHMNMFCRGYSDGRADYISRPLLVHVMEYSTSDVVRLMIKAGVDLTEYYAEKEPHGPIAFHAFQRMIGLRTTYEIAKEAPVDIRDSNGSTMLHHAVNLFQTIKPSDIYGREWATLIVSVLLKRGVRLDVRDQWGRTARDLSMGNKVALCGPDNHHHHHLMNHRPIEEEGPDPYEIRELVDPITNKLLSAQQLIDQRVAFLIRINDIETIEEFLLYGYDQLDMANSGPPRYKSGRRLAQINNLIELTQILDKADLYRSEMIMLQQSVGNSDDKMFSRLIGEKRHILSRDFRGRSLLHLAVIYQRIQMVFLLIDICPQLINTKDCLGRTPFHYAICLPDNRSLFLKMVSKHGGIDKSIKDLRNMSIRQFGDAFEKNIPEFRNLIQSEINHVIIEHSWLLPKRILESNQNSDQRSVSEENLALGQVEGLSPTTIKSKHGTGKRFEDPTAVINCSALAFPCPGAFNAAVVRRIYSYRS